MRSGDRAAFSGASLLLAEDDPLNADIAARTLQKMGCRVTVASDGLIAVRACEEGQFDLILMDCEMAEMDGLEASRRIRALEMRSNKVRTPIVALSAHAPADIRERCLAAGMDGVMAKPFREALLHETLCRWIEGKEGPGQDEKVEISAAHSDAMPVIDREALEGISAFKGRNGQILLKSMITRFDDASRTQLKLLQKHQGEGATEEVKRIAHTLRSSSGALGAARVSRCCAEIESQAALAPLSGTLSALEKELAAAVKRLREIVGEREELTRAAG